MFQTTLVPKYNTRQAKTTKLFLSRVSKQMTKTQLSFKGPQHWSPIPSYVKNFSWTTFKKRTENTLSIAIDLIQYESDLMMQFYRFAFFCRILQRLLKRTPVSAACTTTRNS